MNLYLKILARLGLLAAVMSFLLWQPGARAELWWGEIKGIYDNGSALAMNRLDLEKGGLEEVKVSVTLLTALEGIGTVHELRKGDKVLVEADRDAKTGGWNATSLAIPPEPRT